MRFRGGIYIDTEMWTNKKEIHSGYQQKNVDNPVDNVDKFVDNQLTVVLFDKFLL